MRSNNKRACSRNRGVIVHQRSQGRLPRDGEGRQSATRHPSPSQPADVPPGEALQAAGAQFTLTTVGGEFFFRSRAHIQFPHGYILSRLTVIFHQTGSDHISGRTPSTPPHTN